MLLESFSSGLGSSERHAVEDEGKLVSRVSAGGFANYFPLLVVGRFTEPVEHFGEFARLNLQAVTFRAAVYQSSR